MNLGLVSSGPLFFSCIISESASLNFFLCPPSLRPPSLPVHGCFLQLHTSIFTTEHVFRASLNRRWKTEQMHACVLSTRGNVEISGVTGSTRERNRHLSRTYYGPIPILGQGHVHYSSRCRGSDPSSSSCTWVPWPNDGISSPVKWVLRLISLS